MNMKKLFLIPILSLLLSVEVFADGEYCLSRGNSSSEIEKGIDEKCEAGDLLWVENAGGGLRFNALCHLCKILQFQSHH